MPGLSPRRDGVGQVVNLWADCQSARVAVARGTLWVARSLASCPTIWHGYWLTAAKLPWPFAAQRALTTGLEACDTTAGFAGGVRHVPKANVRS